MSLDNNFQVQSDNCHYSDNAILSNYTYVCSRNSVPLYVAFCGKIFVARETSSSSRICMIRSMGLASSKETCLVVFFPFFDASLSFPFSPSPRRLFRYETTLVEGNIVRPVRQQLQFRTERKVPKVRACDFRSISHIAL